MTTNQYLDENGNFINLLSVGQAFLIIFPIIVVDFHRLFYALFRPPLDQEETFIKQLAGVRGTCYD